jgi:hypothetical protein
LVFPDFSEELAPSSGATIFEEEKSQTFLNSEGGEIKSSKEIIIF